MNAERARRWTALVLAWLIAATAAWGYVHLRDEGGILVLKRYQTPVTLHLSLPTTALSDGTSFTGSVAEALRAWNPHMGAVQLAAGPAVTPGYALGNDRNEIALDARIDGDAFPSGTLAVTISYASGNEMTESDIIFNSAYTWDSYRGPPRTAQDVRRVAIHELGHVLGLHHPDEDWQSVTAIMNSRVGTTELPQADDIHGVQALYGAPGALPANDDFAHATDIELSSGWTQVQGTNIGATREPGEPGHAGATSRRSVWFRWTSPGVGRLAVDTTGSDFDTVLAAYTGSAVSALTLIAANDDAQTPEENPGPTRVRTSRVELPTTAGQVYRFAVDGWGDADQVPDGYTGGIVLMLNFERTLPPVVYGLEERVTVEEGGTARLSVYVESAVEVSYRWQRRLTSTGSWSNLSDDTVYSGTRTDQLTLQATLAMDGQQYRCVVANIAGSVISTVATLDVTRIPPPVLMFQPKSMAVTAGDTAGFRVEVQSTERLQWFRNGVAIAGATSHVLWLPDVQVADAGDYHVVLSNAGTATVSSNQVKLTVLARATITNNGERYREVRVGGVATLGVTAVGEGTLKYQWYHDGRPVAGATRATHDVTVLSAADAGAYWVAVTDGRGTAHGAPFFVVLARGTVGGVAWGNDWGNPLQAEVPADLSGAVALSGAASVFALGENGVPRQINWGGGALVQNLHQVVTMVSAGYTLVALTADGRVFGPWPEEYAPFGLNRVVQIAAGPSWGWTLRTDGTVAAWWEYGPAVDGLKDVVAIAAGARHGVALKRDGTVVQVTAAGDAPVPALPAGLTGVVRIAAGGDSTLALKADGTVVAASSDAGLAPPAGLKDVVDLSVAGGHALALRADGTVVTWGRSDYGDITVPKGLGSVFAIAATPAGCFALREVLPTSVPVIASAPRNTAMSLQQPFTLAVQAAGPPVPGYQWFHNGLAVAGATGAELQRTAEFADAGLYTAVVSSGGATVESRAAIVGLMSFEKSAGAAAEVGADIRHPNGNTFDQVLLTGSAGAVTSDFSENHITRTSYIDGDGDIVQIEFSGPGTLTLVLEGASGPAVPAQYHQPAVQYMKGHAGIVVTGATENTHLSIFTVGRATAYDPTGAYNILRAPDPVANDPAKNGSPLFVGHAATDYDGVADLAFVAISSADGRFGGLRTANAAYFAARGFTGIYAPGVTFTGPVFVGDISAFDAARPVLVLGSATDVRVTGGDMEQPNGGPVQVSGVARLRFAPGSDSHGRTFPAQRNRGRFQQDGSDVTARIVVNP